MSAKVEAVPGGESSEQMLQPKARRPRALEICHGERGQLEVTVSPETLRMYAYGLFGLLVLTCFALTKGFADVDYDKTRIFRIFGYNNVCVYLDYPPAIHVAGYMWVLFLVPWCGYLGTFWIRARAKSAAGLLPERAMRCFTWLTFFEANSAFYFIHVFVNGPEISGLSMHMHPFTIFIVSIFTMSLKEAWYFIVCEELTPREKLYVRVAVAVHLALMVNKVITQINAMLYSQGRHLWKPDHPTARVVGRVLDPLWTLFVILVPVFSAFALQLKIADRVRVNFEFVERTRKDSGV